MNEPIWKKNGKVVTKEEFREGVEPIDWSATTLPRASKTYQEDDPLISESIGCMPHQVSEFRESIREEGITGAKVLDSGQVAFTSKSARRSLMKMFKKHDADGGYGDG